MLKEKGLKEGKQVFFSLSEIGFSFQPNMGWVSGAKSLLVSATVPSISAVWEHNDLRPSIHAPLLNVYLPIGKHLRVCV
jgi:hypothetical protein